MGWTPENIERVRTMASSGLTITQIANSIGGVSRNSIAGVGSRYKIKFLGNDHAISPPKPKPDRVFIPKVIIEPLVPGEAFPESRMVTFDELGKGECRFPFGGHDFRFCGLTALEDRSYCRHHTILTTQPRS